MFFGFTSRVLLHIIRYYYILLVVTRAVTGLSRIAQEKSICARVKEHI